MKPNPNWPVAVFSAAHAEYPKAVGEKRLYCAAFFGHARPEGVKETTESVWRGVCRRALRDYCKAKAVQS